MGRSNRSSGVIAQRGHPLPIAPLMSAACLVVLSLCWGAVAAMGDEPKIPGIMLPELTTVTPELVAKIIAACPSEPLAKPDKPRKIPIFSRCENFTHHSISVVEKALAPLGENDGVVGLAAATPEGFKLTGQFSVQGSGPSWAHPVVCGGRLYLRYDTNLYCFDVKAK